MNETTRSARSLSIGFMVGLCFGGLLPSLSAMLAEYSEHGDEGCVYGMDNAVVSAGRTVGPMLGAVSALYFTARGTFLLTGVIFAASSLLAALTVCRNLPGRALDRSTAASRRP